MSDHLNAAFAAAREQIDGKDRRIKLLECALVTVSANLRRSPDKAPAIIVFVSAIMRGLSLRDAVAEAEKVGDPVPIVEATIPATGEDGWTDAGRAWLAAGAPIIPEGMKPWHGGDEPADWDGGPVLRRHGGVSMPGGAYAWLSNGGGAGNIIAYTPKATSA